MQKVVCGSADGVAKSQPRKSDTETLDTGGGHTVDLSEIIHLYRLQILEEGSKSIMEVLAKKIRNKILQELTEHFLKSADLGFNYGFVKIVRIPQNRRSL